MDGCRSKQRQGVGSEQGTAMIIKRCVTVLNSLGQISDPRLIGSISSMIGQASRPQCASEEMPQMGLWPDRIPDVRHPEKVGLWPDRIPNVRHPEKVGRACMRIEIGVMQSEDMCMDINTMGRPPADVPPRLADEYAW
uniref:Uncharacterized protein n=1 Tax=Vitis vinifera TaxID=29760 RepID=F6HBR3_VITVI